MLASLTWLAASAAEEWKKTVISMLVVGLIFIAVIALGELTHYAGSRRKARKRARSATARASAGSTGPGR